MATNDDRRTGPALPGRLQLVRPARQQMTQAARTLRQEATLSERLLWSALRGGQMRGFKFRRQHPIGPFIVDFFCAASGLIVEIDGPIHHGQHDSDRERQELLESRGYRVLRVRAQEVEQHMASVLQRVAAALADPR